ncbi:unnamed protein product [Symbiodinium sp. KB8]|nr:unnamed protein product [Symbiodinium sp. KB8]
MQAIGEPKVLKTGILKKLGGAAGGHKNWKDRFFVLSDHLYYYNSEAAYKKNPEDILGVVALNAYFCGKVENTKTFEFTVESYPRSMTCRAKSKEDMNEWIEAIMYPIKELGGEITESPDVPEEAFSAAAGGGGGAAEGQKTEE